MTAAWSVWFGHSGRLVTARVDGTEYAWSAPLTERFLRLLRRPTLPYYHGDLLRENDRFSLAVLCAPDGTIVLREVDHGLARESWKVSHTRAMELRSAAGMLQPRRDEPEAAALSAVIETWGPFDLRLQHVTARCYDARVAAVLHHDGGLDGPAYTPARCGECGAPATREPTSGAYSIHDHLAGCSQARAGRGRRTVRSDRL